MSGLPIVHVSAVHNGQRRKLHTFALDAITKHAGQWLAVAVPTAHQRVEISRAATWEGRQIEFMPTRRGVDAGEWLPISLFYGVDFYSLPARVSLAPGVNPRADTLSVILDALATSGRSEVDLDDLKAVLSEQGSRITALLNLTDDAQREIARDALYRRITERCGNFAN